MTTQVVGGGAVQSNGASRTGELDALAASIQQTRALLQRYGPRLGAHTCTPGEHSRPEISPVELAAACDQLAAAGEQIRRHADLLSSAYVALERERRRYLGLTALLPDAYFVTDAKGTIREANHAASAVIGYARKYCVGKPLLSFVLPEEASAFQARLARAQDLTGDSVHTWEIRLRPLRKHARLDALVRVSAIRDEGGLLSGLRWLVRDITAEKQRAEELAALTAEQGARLRAQTAELEAIVKLQTARIEQEQAARIAAESRLRAYETCAGEMAAGVEDFLRALGAEDTAIAQVLGRLLEVAPAVRPAPAAPAQLSTRTGSADVMPGEPSEAAAADAAD